MSKADIKKSSIAEIYGKALDFFQDKNRWAQGYYQFDKEGNQCPWAEGYSFCALGAVAFFGDGDSVAARCCLQRVSEHLYGKSIQTVNDDDPDAYEKVTAAFKFAIALWKDRQPSEEDLGKSVDQILRERNG